MQHISVLETEISKFFAPKKNENFIDATVGLGGHAASILRATAPQGKLLAIDWDIKALNQAKENLREFGDRVIYRQGNYKDVVAIAKNCGFNSVKGILMDLGLGSWQLDDLDYGMSFKSNALLDLRFQKIGQSAAELVRFATVEELTKILQEFGDEPKARVIATKICEVRKMRRIITMQDLVNIVESVKPRYGKIHPATQTIQALRIAVNNEQTNLTQALQTITEYFNHSILAVISFHSGEDRIVKRFFKANKENLQIITSKPITPSFAEMKLNPRSRSAKLRVVNIVKGEGNANRTTSNKYKK